MNWEDWSPEDEEGGIAERESARLRREATQYEERLAAATQKLVEMNPEELDPLNLPNELQAAISVARPLKPSKARNRQIRLITKFFRKWEEAEGTEALEKVERSNESKANQLRAVELWRTALMEHGDVALGVLLSHSPSGDRQYLRQLCRTTAKAKTETKKQRAHKELFQALKKLNITEGPPQF
ncbi:MAG: ribosome biogenesis factor YjgA [Myxococcota bacterium]|nr:ribosome biogenesis factor YjgA [Myxococcota bacterium]